jgi:hypothetical protein
VNGTNVGTDGNLPLLFGGRGRCEIHCDFLSYC